jgi:hypothetical protein
MDLQWFLVENDEGLWSWRAVQGPVSFSKTAAELFPDIDDARADAVVAGWVAGEEPMWVPDAVNPPPAEDVLVGTFRSMDVNAAQEYINFSGLANDDQVRFV